MMANLINKDTKSRTTLSYAKYLLCVKHKRVLSRQEEADHIDNDKTNDDINNLQILTKVENMQKQAIKRRLENPVFIVLNCTRCGNPFEYLKRNHKFHTKSGRLNFYCSRKCYINT